MRCLAAAFALSSLLVKPARARAAPGPSEEDTIGFGEEPIQPAASPAAASPTDSDASEWALTGGLQLQAARGLVPTAPADQLNKLRQVASARLEFKHTFGDGVEAAALASLRTEVDWAYLAGLNQPNTAVLEVYAWQVLPMESWLRLHTSILDVTIGNQIVNFGQGEVLSVLDTVNPRDLREPLLGDPAEVRVPTLATRISLGAATMRADAVIVHEAYFGLQPPPLGTFSPFRRLLVENPATGPALSDRVVRTEHVPARDFDPAATQVHGRVSWSGAGVDLSLHAASLLDAYGTPAMPPPISLLRPDIALLAYHPRYTLLGHSGALTFGPLLLRWEFSLELAKPVSLRRTDTPLLEFSMQRANWLRGLVGVTWVPSTITSLGVEVLDGYALEEPWKFSQPRSAPLFPLDAPQIAARFTQRFIHERGRFDVVLLWLGLKPFNSAAARVELAYLVADGFELSIGGVAYLATDEFGPFYGFEDNQRVFCNVRWSFAVD